MFLTFPLIDQAFTLRTRDVSSAIFIATRTPPAYFRIKVLSTYAIASAYSFRICGSVSWPSFCAKGRKISLRVVHWELRGDVLETSLVRPLHQTRNLNTFLVMFFGKRRSDTNSRWPFPPRLIGSSVLPNDNSSSAWLLNLNCSCE